MTVPIQEEIALTHILTRKKQTLVAAMGVTIGIALYIFSNSIVSGVSSYSKTNMFKTVPHLAIYAEEELSKPILPLYGSYWNLISNPKSVPTTKNIHHPQRLMELIQKLPFVLQTAPQVNVDLFYQSSKSQLKGVASGIQVIDSDAMFNIRSTMRAGSLQDLSSDLNGIIIGQGIAEKLHLQLHDHLKVTSSLGVQKTLQVIGIFATDNKAVDESKAYVHLATAQQLIQAGPQTITHLYIKLTNPDSSAFYAAQIAKITDYHIDDWQMANADQLAQNKMIGTMTPLISLSIMLVASFGIYNIIHMTITQKMNDIAILKANGFKGKDIVRIFLSEALIMGITGTTLGVLLGAILVQIAKGIYVGPPVGFFPIDFDLRIFLSGILFGLSVSLGAGYFPARKASKVDPVAIFRK